MTDYSDTFKEFLLSKEPFFLFITFILGRESPCYKDTFSKPGENWDNSSRPTPLNTDALVSTLGKLINYCIQTQNQEYPLPLSEKDLLCLKHPGFLKLLYKEDLKMFDAIVCLFSYNNLEFTLSTCKELLKYIEDNMIYNEEEVHKIFKSIYPILALKDDLQRLRFELLIGYPQQSIEELNTRYNMPYFGFHKMNDKDSKTIEFKSLLQSKHNCCLMKKIFNLRYRERICSEIFISLLEESFNNPPLFKYIITMPAEEAKYPKYNLLTIVS